MHSPTTFAHSRRTNVGDPARFGPQQAAFHRRRTYFRDLEVFILGIWSTFSRGFGDTFPSTEIRRQFAYSRSGGDRGRLETECVAQYLVDGVAA